LYFTGGEPLISSDHWNLLKILIEKKLSHKVALVYNSNLTVVKYKNLDIESLWKEFKSVSVMVSFDAIGETFENIRSNAVWADVERNIELFKTYSFVKLSVCCVLSILNIWHLEEFSKFCLKHKLPIQFVMLDGPDYLALDVIPDEFKDLALEQLLIAQQLLGYNDFFNFAKSKVINNINQCLINQTINHVLLLDKIRDENMFDHLPFGQYSKNLILRNHEYE